MGLPLGDPRSPAVVPGIPRPRILGALTSLRFLIALHVGLYHFVRPFTRWGLLLSFFGAGYTGVSFFFLLSGFILTYTHAAEYEAGRGRAKRFWMARFARIYPVYLLSVLLAGYVGHRMLAYPLERHAFGADFFMVQAWSSRLVRNFNVASWSLSCEAFFYLVFPFVVLRLRMRGRGAYLLGIAGWVLVGMAAPAWAWLHYRGPAMHEFPVTETGWGEVFRIRRLPLLALPEFCAGISLGWLYLQHGVGRRAARLLSWGGILALIVVLCGSQVLPYVFLHNGLLIPLQCAIILGLCGQHWLTRVLSHRWLMVLGEASYSFYLIHLLIFDWMGEHFHTPATIANALWRLPLIVAVSVLLYLYVERPCRRRLLQWYSRPPRMHPANT